MLALAIVEFSLLEVVLSIDADQYPHFGVT